MPKNTILIILSIIILGVLIFKFINSQSSTFDTATVKINGSLYTLEVAKTISQKSKGLSQRNSLCQNCGMLFTFPTDSIWPFWMKDTLIPLDIIWLDKDYKIVSIQTAQAESNTPESQLKVYQNSTPAKYVIELNSGEANKNNLKIGDTLYIDYE